MPSSSTSSSDRRRLRVGRRGVLRSQQAGSPGSSGDSPTELPTYESVVVSAVISPEHPTQVGLLMDSVDGDEEDRVYTITQQTTKVTSGSRVLSLTPADLDADTDAGAAVPPATSITVVNVREDDDAGGAMVLTQDFTAVTPYVGPLACSPSMEQSSRGDMIDSERMPTIIGRSSGSSGEGRSRLLPVNAQQAVPPAGHVALNVDCPTQPAAVGDKLAAWGSQR
ncbi:hypothetical protein EON62_06665, partial [archaeon]